VHSARSAVVHARGDEVGAAMRMILERVSGVHAFAANIEPSELDRLLVECD
jgi:hypothetical protein